MAAAEVEALRRSLEVALAAIQEVREENARQFQEANAAIHQARAENSATREIAAQAHQRGPTPKLSSHFREYLQEDGQNTALWNSSLRGEVDRYGLLNFLDVPGFQAGSPTVQIVRSMLLQSMESGVRLQLEGAMALANLPGGVLQQHPATLYGHVMATWNAMATQKRHVLQTKLNTIAMQDGEDVGKFFIRLAKLHSEMRAAGMQPQQSELVDAAIRATRSHPQYNHIAAAIITMGVTNIDLSTLQQRYLAWEERLRGQTPDEQPTTTSAGPTPMMHAAVTETTQAVPEARNEVEELIAALRTYGVFGSGRGRGRGWRGGRGSGWRGAAGGRGAGAGGRGAGGRGAGRRCYTCGQVGHLSWECPSRNATTDE